MVGFPSYVLRFLLKRVKNHDVLFFVSPLADTPFEGSGESSVEFSLVDGYPCYSITHTTS